MVSSRRGARGDGVHARPGLRRFSGTTAVGSDRYLGRPVAVGVDRRSAAAAVTGPASVARPRLEARIPHCSRRPRAPRYGRNDGAHHGAPVGAMPRLANYDRVARAQGQRRAKKPAATTRRRRFTTAATTARRARTRHIADTGIGDIRQIAQQISDLTQRWCARSRTATNGSRPARPATHRSCATRRSGNRLGCDGRNHTFRHGLRTLAHLTGASQAPVHDVTVVQTTARLRATGSPSASSRRVDAQDTTTRRAPLAGGGRRRTPASCRRNCRRLRTTRSCSDLLCTGSLRGVGICAWAAPRWAAIIRIQSIGGRPVSG